MYAKPEQGEIVFSFVCRILEGTPTTSVEADDVRYFVVHQVPGNTCPKQVERIHDALRETDQTVLKTQVGPSDAVRSPSCS